jgi:hypothetical protein
VSKVAGSLSPPRTTTPRVEITATSLSGSRPSFSTKNKNSRVVAAIVVVIVVAAAVVVVAAVAAKKRQKKKRNS